MKRAPPLGPELRQMVWPLRPEQFLAQHYRRRHFVSHGPPQRVRPLLEALGAGSVEQYLARRREPVQVWYQTHEGDYGFMETSPQDAAGLHRSGLTVFIHRVGELAPWKQRLGAQLGFEEVGGGALFGARRGSGTRWHFDKLENFTVQLRGAKRWRVAPNAQVENPLDNWVTRQGVTDEMGLYIPDALPREAPPGKSETVELKPGSVLYVPRGYWHTAEASSGDTLAVTFLFAPTTWVSRFIAALNSRLTALPAWREHAAEVLGDLRDDGRAREKAGALLGQLRELVGELRPEDFVPPEGRVAPRITARTRLRRNPLAFLHVGLEGPEGLRVVRLVVESLRPRRFDLEIEPELAPVCSFVARCRGAFLASEAAGEAGGVPFTRVAALLRLLREAGILQQR